MYGGNSFAAITAFAAKGLSPRVRGKPGTEGDRLETVRSIPACTGETWCIYRGEDSFEGLSPRVRGKLMRARLCIHLVRSIPACTGETVMAVTAKRLAPVYPRVYGGNTCWPGVILPTTGLSPRVRGKLQAAGSHMAALWSIPACTGETGLHGAATAIPEVYPRVYGGNRQMLCNTCKKHGLSPRVRGKHAESGWLHRPLRSIPACTGETHGLPVRAS